MQAHDEMVPSAGHGDVQEAEPLREFVALLIGPFRVVARRGHERPGGADADSQLRSVRTPEDRRGLVRRQGVEPGQDHDRELQPLGAVHGQDSQRRVVRLGGDGLVDPDTFVGLAGRPLHESSEAGSARVFPGAGLIQEEPDPAPVVARPSVHRRELEQASLADDRLDGAAYAAPPAVLPEPVEDGEGVVDPALRLGVASIVPGPTRRGVSDQLRVAAAERGRSERGDDRELVGRIVDGGEDVQQIADLAGRKDQALTLHAHRDARSLERALEGGEHGAGRDQQCDVVRRGRPDGAVRVVDRPALRDDLLGHGRHLVGFPLAHVSHRLVVVGSQHHDPVLLGASLPVGHQRRMRRLHPRILGEELREDRVDDGQDRRHRAEVLDQLDRQETEPLPGLVVHPQIRAAEPVDGLLRVADQHQGAGADRDVAPVEVPRVGGLGGEEHRQFGLEGIGVLELVDEEVPVPVARRGPRRRVVPEQIAGEDEQVVEEQPALAAPQRGVVAGERDQPPGEDRQGRASLLGDHLQVELLGRRAGRSCGVDIGPVGLPAGPLALEGGEREDGLELVEVVARVREAVSRRGELGDVAGERVVVGAAGALA